MDDVNDREFIISRIGIEEDERKTRLKKHAKIINNLKKK
jgi:hypothetical protein